MTRRSSWRTVWNVLRHEWKNSFANLNTFLMVTLLPLILTGQSVGIFAGLATSTRPEDLQNPLIRSAIGKFSESLAAHPGLASLSSTEKFQLLSYLQFPVYMLLIPMMIAGITVTFSIVEEKQNRTLEPLLATPARTWEILLAKALSGMLPATLVSWFCGALFVGAAALFRPAFMKYTTGAEYWLVFAAALVPLTGLLASLLGVIASSRARDAKNAQGVFGILILPLFGVVGLSFTGLVAYSLAIPLVLSGVLAVLNVILLRATVKVFSRETILTRWKF